MWLLAQSALAARLLLLGDAGHASVELARAHLDAGTPCGPDCPEAQHVALLRQIDALAADPARRPDVAVLLGDNYYGADSLQTAPACLPRRDSPGDREAVAAIRRRYHAVIGPLQAAGVPVVGVLGNHDVGHRVTADWRRRRACSVAAATAEGWLLPSSHGTLQAEGWTGYLHAVDTNELLAGARWAPQRSAFEHSGAWAVWAGHHAWSLQADKAAQPADVRRRMAAWWDQAGWTPPDRRIWVNGHAHHQEADLHEGWLAITAGAGSKERASECKDVDPPEVGLYRAQGLGYTLLEIGEDAPTAHILAIRYDGTVDADVHLVWEGAWRVTSAVVAAGREPCPGSVTTVP